MAAFYGQVVYLLDRQNTPVFNTHRLVHIACCLVSFQSELKLRPPDANRFGHPSIMSPSGGFQPLYEAKENRVCQKSTVVHHKSRLRASISNSKISANPANRGRNTSTFQGK